MTKITVVIEDDDQGQFTMVGTAEDPTAFNGPPTPALVFCSYLGSHAEQVAQDAWKWFRDGAKADDK